MGSEKNDINIAKHGVSFFEAQSAFLDPDRIIAEDLGNRSGTVQGVEIRARARVRARARKTVA